MALRCALALASQAPPPGLRMIVDDGDPTLAYTGYRLYVEDGHYLIRVWHKNTFAAILDRYKTTLLGEPRSLLWSAFDARSWDDIPADGSGPWGPGDMYVYPESVDPMVRKGLLLP